ncbi:MAG: sigma factor [Eubacteriales bacterium]|nr:sigma factor [Eubacteriales bacterium]
MRDIDEAALRASSDPLLLTDFIESKNNFIIGCASKAAKKYITKSDDEWSVALVAFLNAVKTYRADKSGFLPYAETIIKNRLTDYYRGRQKYKAELSVDPYVFNCEPEEEDENSALKTVIAEKLAANQSFLTEETSPVKDEIDTVTKIFRAYGFSFYDLASCSPKSVKTKEACKKAVVFMLDNEALLGEMKKSKLLPIKNIRDFTKLPRKLLEHHRRYIIAAAEILSGEYPCLAEYVSFIRKGAE